MAKESVSDVLGSKSKKSETKSGKKSSKKGGKDVHRMHIRRSANGGYIAEHHAMPGDDGMPSSPTEEHTLPDIASLQDHVGEHMAPPAGADEPAPQPAPAPVV